MRLAAARALLDFLAGSPFAGEPPDSLGDPTQRRLYVQLLRGTVRHLRLLEAELERLAARPLARMDAEARVLGVLGLYQLRFLETAPHAAVYETVALAAALGRPHLTGWVNAVLRAAQREAQREAQRDEETPTALSLAQRTSSLALRTSHPDWMVARWQARYGAERAMALCEANNRYEGAALRVETVRIGPEALRARLAAEGVPADAHPLLPEALWVEHVGALLQAPAFREGLAYVQDVTSQVLMRWVAPLLRGRVLDACAAPGGKLTQLLAGRAPGDWIVGAEHAPARMAQVRENLARLGLGSAPLLRADARALPCAAGAWDALLLDVPCSATGMIRKYPELKWRKHAEDLPRFAETQAALLDEAARALRPRGTIVYVTCSLEPEENEGAVEAFLARQPRFRRRPFGALPAPPGLGQPAHALITDAGDLQFLPADRQMGLYAALLHAAE